MAEEKRFEEEGGQLIAFTAGGNYYAFEILSVTDIMEVPEITHIPKTPPYLLGITNLRGKAVPVMDLRLRLGLPEGNYDHRSCVIVIELNSLQFGIRVDRVADVESCLPEQIVLSPAENGVVKGFVNVGDRRIFLINADRLIRG